MAGKLEGDSQVNAAFSFPNIPSNGSTGSGYVQYGQLLICYGQVEVAAAPNTGTGNGSTTGTSTYAAFAKTFVGRPTVCTVITNFNLWYTWVQAVSTTGVNLRQNHVPSPLHVMYIAIGTAA